MATAARASAPTRVRQERERALNARANAIVPLLLELNEANKDASRDEWEQQAYTRGLRGLEKSWRARQRAGQLRVVLKIGSGVTELSPRR